jgi:hypothetical protein
MSYGNTKRNNITYLEDLPDLQDLEETKRGSRMPNNPIPEKYQKFIRGSYSPPSQSGMNPPQMHKNYMTERYSPPIPSQGQIGQIGQIGEESPSRILADSPSCLEIADHVSACPICSRFYNSDRSVYIIAIVMLAIICILLLKKVLNL